MGSEMREKVKSVIVVLYVAVVMVMAAATFIEKDNGTRYVAEHVYGAWWFSLLWGLLAAFGVAWIAIRRMRRPSVLMLHASFVIILAGALLTHLTARQGMVHLRVGIPQQSYQLQDGTMQSLPYTVRLDSFVVSCHSGTKAAADYLSYITIGSGRTAHRDVVSMNHIVSYKGVRFCQSSYDDDLCGSVLAVNSDPWGIPVTYAGYALLFVAFVWLLFDPKGSYRKLLLLVCLFASQVQAQPVVPRATADRFARLHILYNDRVCPVETYALDFAKKIYGHRSYKDYTATQILTGFIFYGNEWSQEPVVKVKSGELKSRLQLPDYCPVNTFFNPTMGGYILGPYIDEYYRGNRNDGFHRQAAQIDDRLMLVLELRQGKSLLMFPYTNDGRTTWYSPTERIDTAAVPAADRLFMRNIFSLLNEEVHAGHWNQVDGYLDKMLSYQQKHAGNSLPTATCRQAERLYNAIPFATILFMVCLTLGGLLLAVSMVRGSLTLPLRCQQAGLVALAVAFLALTLCLALRWIISGTVPMSNGYETMLLMAWMLQLVTLCLQHRFRILLSFGFLLSGFFLLVSHISQMDPQIGQLMPVLRSPLLALHVSVIMMAFALLSLTFICGLTAIIARFASKNYQLVVVSLANLSRLFLYPALALLSMGIFIGAVWANQSWGTYWSWDPKETWALITLMVYAVAVHDRSFPALRRPMPYLLFTTLAFLTVVMTYFGVNYILGGMHSYA